jgi:long-chain fatty acid transport protein
MPKILAAALLLPALALANGYDVPNVNPRDLAMADSAVAAQRDAAATYRNPAALSRVEGLSLSLGGSVLEIDTKWSAPAGSGLTGSAKTQFKPAPPVSLFAAYGTKLFGRNAGVGLGMNIPAGGNVYWNDDWAGRGRIITVDRKLYGFYLAGGYELLPRVRLGGGVTYIHTTEYMKLGIQPFDGAYGELNASGGGWSYDVSADVQPVESLPLTFGIDYKHKTTPMALTGDGHFVLPAAVTGGANQDQNARHVLTFPNALQIGAAYRPIQSLLVTAGYSFNRYKLYTDDTFTGSQGFLKTVPRNYDNGYTFRLGGEYEATPRLTLRAGVLRDISGYDPANYSPTLPDSNTWAFAVGGGWKVTPDLAFNGTFFYALMDKVTTTDWASAANPGGTFPGIFNTNVWIASVCLTWRTDLGVGGGQ